MLTVDVPESSRSVTEKVSDNLMYSGPWISSLCSTVTSYVTLQRRHTPACVYSRRSTTLHVLDKRLSRCPKLNVVCIFRQSSDLSRKGEPSRRRNFDCCVFSRESRTNSQKRILEFRTLVQCTDLPPPKIPRLNPKLRSYVSVKVLLPRNYISKYNPHLHVLHAVTNICQRIESIRPVKIPNHA